MGACNQVDNLKDFSGVMLATVPAVMKPFDEFMKKTIPDRVCCCTCSLPVRSRLFNSTKGIAKSDDGLSLWVTDLSRCTILHFVSLDNYCESLNGSCPLSKLRHTYG